MKITVETTVRAAIGKVWRAYTADIKRWKAASKDWHMTAATVDLQEGGTFSSRIMADPDPARVKRVVQAMKEMVKLDIAALEAAAASR